MLLCQHIVLYYKNDNNNITKTKLAAEKNNINVLLSNLFNKCFCTTGERPHKKDVNNTKYIYNIFIVLYCS